MGDIKRILLGTRYYYPHHVSVVENLFQKYKTGVILDAGCGSKSSIPWLLPNIKKRKNGELEVPMRQYVGVDICRSNVMVHHRNNRDCDLIVASLTHLPFKSEVFDVAISADVLEHLKEKKKALAEITRTIKTKSHFVGSTSNILNPFMLIDSVSSVPSLGLIKYVGKHYERQGRLTPKKLCRLLNSLGCVVSLQFYGIPPFRSWIYEDNYRFRTLPLHVLLWILFNTMTDGMKILKEIIVFDAVKYG